LNRSAPPALAAVRRVKTLSANQAIRTAVSKIANDPTRRLQEQAIALYSDGSHHEFNRARWITISRCSSYSAAFCKAVTECLRGLPLPRTPY